MCPLEIYQMQVQSSRVNVKWLYLIFSPNDRVACDKVAQSSIQSKCSSMHWFIENMDNDNNEE